MVQTGRSCATRLCSNASLSDRRQHFGHRLISRKLALRCGVVASLARPISLGLFPSGCVRLKRTHVREPLTVIEFKIAIARESPRSPPISAAVQWTTTGTSHFCHFLHISLKSHQSWQSESIWLKPSPDTSPKLEINSSKNEMSTHTTADFIQDLSGKLFSRHPVFKPSECSAPRNPIVTH